MAKFNLMLKSYFDVYTITLDYLFDDTNGVINFDTIPYEQVEAKNHFEKYYFKYSILINKPCKFQHKRGWDMPLYV